MTAQSPPARRKTERAPLRPVLLALLISVSVTGAAWLGAVYAAPESFEGELAWGAGVAAAVVCAAVVTAAIGVVRARWLRARLRAAEADAAHFAEETVPALVARLREGSSAPTALAAAEQPADPAHQTVLRTVAEEIGRGETAKSAAMAACANAAGRMQALATGMLADLREMEHRHGDEAVLADLLHLDHRTAQAGRLADSIAVLTGARSGRRWAKPIVMESILRGAMGRIGGYQRVRLHCAVNVAIAGHAAEGVMHALAELLDNAANFSPPTAEVHVYVEEVPAGVIMTVEDSGLVMSDVALRRAERAVSRDHPLDLTSLSGTRLGLAVVGVLARKHGLSVSFRPSARGGTGALMMIPHDLISRPSADGDQPAARPRTAPTGPPAAAAGAAAAPAPALVAAGPIATADHAPMDAMDDDAVAGTGAGPVVTEEDVAYSTNGLPKRRRGRTLANAHPDGVPGAAARARRAEPAERRHSPERSAARLVAFRQAVRGTQESQEIPVATNTGRTSNTANTANAANAAGAARADGGRAADPATAPPETPATHTASATPATPAASSAAHPEDDDA
ncbi:sensor histidine kinase [Streptomyces sp. 6N223]|uniref:sensor histidine kinase n=1 Tax=Streptomyces sp. 6N223 TaxID=3457412 RepID=UPI003FD15214